jgi:hypothetical protein
MTDTSQAPVPETDDEYRLIAAGKACADAEASSAKVIVVTEASGRERRYAATQWDDSGSRLVILRKGHPVASYPMDGELGVREDSAEVPYATARALGIARRALSEIVRRADDGGEQPFGRPEIAAIASTALNDIRNETAL